MKKLAYNTKVDTTFSSSTLSEEIQSNKFEKQNKKYRKM